MPQKAEILVFGAVIALWLVWGAAISLVTPTFEKAGQFGDLYGGVNALFTALAFAAVWWTGRMQKEELELQRKELVTTREEVVRNREVAQQQADQLTAQADQLARTRAVMSTQSFESTFFSMLQILRGARDETTVGSESGKTIYFKFGSQVIEASKTQTTGNGHMDAVIKVYDQWQSQFPDTFFIYVRTYTAILRFVEKFPGDVDSRQTYVNILNSQLSVGESLVVALSAQDGNNSELQTLVEDLAALRPLAAKLTIRGAIQRKVSSRAFE